MTPQQIQHIGLVIRPGIEAAVALAAQVVDWAHEQGRTVLFESESAELFGSKAARCSSAELVQRCDLIITLGGDGTLLSVARHSDSKAPLFLGVNFGVLGFLTEVRPTELQATLERLLRGDLYIRERAMLLGILEREGKVVFSSQAVNDFVVQKGARSRLIDLDVFLDDEAIMRLRADGMIVATPTGSTAYSLACGGPIADPSLNVMMLTPICPHSLTSRPLVVDSDSVARIVVPHIEDLVFLTADGQVSCELKPGDVIRITRAKHRLRLLSAPTRSYFEILRTKLNWGVPNKNE
ncbi:MAG: NAD(+)/NADH kinase [Bdellovibrionota bacterium]|nr:MAG: NAD(+)/NADH kinase [Bdellovibrionota bacterium]